MNDLDYPLPPDRVAVAPAEPRDHSRLLVVRRAGEAVEHRRFFQIAEYLRPGDLLVTNNTRVLPARLMLYRKSGAAIPGLFVAERGLGRWEVMLRTRGKAREGEELVAEIGGGEGGGGPVFRLDRRLGEGMWEVTVSPGEPAAEVLARIGAMPIPPYIERARREGPGAMGGAGGAGGAREATPAAARDRDWYQTVYAEGPGKSVAAPTAGLHFTRELLQRIVGMGVRHAAVELEVGLGTFLPVETETFEAHRMHRERYKVPAETVRALRSARDQGRRIVVVGTTAVRTLETVAGEVLTKGQEPRELAGETELKISPGFNFQLTDLLVTNFHLPRSTLMALVGALVGVERLKALYGLAVREGYRFYSYGDAMLILP